MSSPHGDWAANLSQTIATIKDFARVTAGYYQALVDQGVPPEHATLLTSTYVDTLMRMNHSGEE